MILPERTFDPDNMNEPLSTVGSIEDLSIDYRLQNSIRMVLNKVELYDDKYDFFKESLKKEYSDIDRITSQIKIRETNLPVVPNIDLRCDPANKQLCKEYMTIEISSGGKKITMTR